jgi:hypothetical protein
MSSRNIQTKDGIHLVLVFDGKIEALDKSIEKLGVTGVTGESKNIYLVDKTKDEIEKITGGKVGIKDGYEALPPIRSSKQNSNQGNKVVASEIVTFKPNEIVRPEEITIDNLVTSLGLSEGFEQFGLPPRFIAEGTLMACLHFKDIERKSGKKGISPGEGLKIFMDSHQIGLSPRYLHGWEDKKNSTLRTHMNYKMCLIFIRHKLGGRCLIKVEHLSHDQKHNHNIQPNDLAAKAWIVAERDLPSMTADVNKHFSNILEMAKAGFEQYKSLGYDEIMEISRLEAIKQYACIEGPVATLKFKEIFSKEGQGDNPPLADYKYEKTGRAPTFMLEKRAVVAAAYMLGSINFHHIHGGIYSFTPEREKLLSSDRTKVLPFEAQRRLLEMNESQHQPKLPFSSSQNIDFMRGEEDYDPVTEQAESEQPTAPSALIKTDWPTNVKSLLEYCNGELGHKYYNAPNHLKNAWKKEMNKEWLDFWSNDKDGWLRAAETLIQYAKKRMAEKAQKEARNDE